jgi:dipeptidyl-peptidase 4
MNQLLARPVLSVSALLVTSAALFGASPPAPKDAQPTAPTVNVSSQNEDFLRQYAQTLHFALGRPKSITVVPDGSAVLFLRSGPRSFVHDLYEFDCATGQERVLLTADQILGGGEEHLTAEEHARRERLRLSTKGIAGYELSEDGSKLVVPLSGRLFVVDRKTAKSTEVKSTAGSPQDARLSPDGKLLACVRDGEIYVTDLAAGTEKKVTTGAGGTITNGLPEFVAQEEMDRFAGYWWSPDSKMIAFQQTDTAGMEVFRIPDPVHPETPANEWPYPRPGMKNAAVKLAVVPASGGEPTWIKWDSAAYPYLATVKWAKNAPLTFLVQNRRQTEELLLAADEKTGTTKELLREKDAAWINLEQTCPLWLKDGTGFLWMTEREGSWSLEVRAADGSLSRTLMKGQGLESLKAVDQKRGRVYVAADLEGTQVHVLSLPLSGAPDARIFVLTTKAGQHGAEFSDDGSVWVHSYNLADGSSGLTVERTPGSEGKPEIGQLKSVAEEPPFMPKVEFTKVGAQGLEALIIRPRDFDPKKKYPVIDSVYGGPHTNMVNATPRGYVLQQWLADQGFIVVSIDGRGTPRRGRDWERSIKNNVIDGPLDDQVEGLKDLGTKYPEMDMARVGITGWSFGGYFSAIASMRRPDIFKAGAAGAPVVDWRDYDTHYTERYLGLPDTDKAGYDKSSVLTYCKDLKVPLLIIHGTADDNVYFMHSLKMTEALFRAGKTFEFLPLAGFTHMVPDPEVTVKLQGRIVTFFKKNLGDPR